MEFLDNLKKYVNSPEGMAMAQSLLSNSGASRRPIRLGEALGQGLLAGQSAKQKDFDNKHKTSMFDLQKEGMGLRREGLENQKLSTQAYIDNMRQAQARASQELNMKMQDRAKQAKAMENMQKLFGTPETYAPGPQTYTEGPQTYSQVPTPLMNAGEQIPNPREQIPNPIEQIAQGTGSGLLGGKVNEKQFKQEMAQNLLSMGEIEKAMSLLATPKGPSTKPETIMINGQPTLAQFDNRIGEYVPVKGNAQPMPKNGLSITAPDGTVTRVGGTPGNASGLAKPTINEIEKRMTTTKTILDGVKALNANYDPKYFSAQGKIKNQAIRAADYVEYPLTEKQQEFNGKRAAFEHDTRRTLHTYMQSVVGSRGGIKMLEQMEKSFPNMEMRPNEMKWALDKIQKNLEHNLKTLDELRKTGKFTEEEIKQKVDEQAFKGMEEIINKVVKGGPEINRTLKALDKSENDPEGLFK